MKLQSAIIILTFIAAITCFDNWKNEEVEEYDENTIDCDGIPIYYDYYGLCSQESATCTTAEGCDKIASAASDLCPQRDSKVICCSEFVGGVQIYEKEFACAMLGGHCVQRNDCYPEEITTVKGLCPKNRYNGVECCYRVKFPKKIQKCEEDFSGACMQRCHERLRRPADDCLTGEHCCVLVN